uniref:Uncharacterized protein n=1 Tax=Avena sativa TaxID=4498 RepID=A0ACD5YTW2_AVESA
MKSHRSALSSPKRIAAIAAPVAFLLALGLVLLYDLSFSDHHYYRRIYGASSSASSPACDLMRGDWVPDDAEAPYYTNLTCPFIDDHQNCMKFGKPSLEFVRWRWRPDGCELPRFDAARFLDSMRGKSMAFVGDSLARNHFKSLLCLLSKVAQPVEVGAAPEIDVTGRAVRQDYYFSSHDFTASLFWSPFLVKANLSNASLGMWDVHLDTADVRWAAHVADFDHVVLSGTNWFFRPSVYYEGGRAVACNGDTSCGTRNVTTELAVPRALRAAFRTALGAIATSEGFRGKAVLRTVTPTHFENGEWNTGGDCVRTRPYRRGDRAVSAAEYRNAQVEALRETEEAAATRNGAELLLMDISEAMELRPDGHPSRYGHPPGGSVEGSFVVDCLHWCLPGPIDLWSELLFQMLLPHR